MGADGGDDEGGQLLAEDGPPGREAVGGRADGGADDEPVAAVAGDPFVVNDEFEVNHVKGGPGLDGDLVKPQEGAPAGRLLDHALEHQVPGDAEVAPDHAGQAGAQLVGPDVGEEAELAEVDAED